MAKISFFLQAISADNHAQAISKIFSLKDLSQPLISVAFVRTSGISELENVLLAIPVKPKIFIGIRNEITSVQAVKQLLTIGAEVYVVDTGSRNVIFHPKIYLTSNNDTGNAIIGSANLTFGGLQNNIEGSTCIEFDMHDATDKAIIVQIRKVFDDMISSHPQHVFRVMDDKKADDLFAEGRLADEAVIPAPTRTKSNSPKAVNSLPPMALHRKAKPQKSQLPKTPTAQAPVAAAAAPNPPGTALPHNPPPTSFTSILFWESKELNERDLNIPTGNNTNPTGSMGLKKGRYDQIDQRHYFYDVVFKGLNWTKDPKTQGKLRAAATCELVIAAVNHGTFDLPISHDTRTNTKSYRQSNMMTHLSWAAAKKFVADKALLGRNMKIYRKNTTPPEFVIEID